MKWGTTIYKHICTNSKNVQYEQTLLHCIPDMHTVNKHNKLILDRLGLAHVEPQPNVLCFPFFMWDSMIFNTLNQVSILRINLSFIL